MSMIKADPRKRRQLSAKGPLLFWRTGADEASRSGLVVVVNACVNPGCACRDAALFVYRVDHHLAGVEMTGESIQFFFPKDIPTGADKPVNAYVLLAHLDLDTGQIEISTNAAEDRRDESALAWLREEFDGQVLDHIANHVLRMKGGRPLMRVEVANFQPPQMVGFGEAYAHGRLDAYIIDGRRIDVLDVYCVDPTCLCTEMRLATQCDKRSLGFIVVDLTDPDRPRFEGKPVLARLWQAFRLRYPSLDVFRKREAKMKEAGPSITAQAKAQHRVVAPMISRNQPCPCGSGKKYKRCCIGKTVQPPTV